MQMIFACLSYGSFGLATRLSPDSFFTGSALVFFSVLFLVLAFKEAEKNAVKKAKQELSDFALSKRFEAKKKRVIIDAVIVE